ncbi:hypothetical protein K491DRAFT_125394 [Lophiostoma macrostomum CBS 122681]|uniref:Uncharacterized protein n=1 Tax=Lophiostoma macrostomum CBS 122681 TaxID=1314788 RepID=A0A6A6SSM1_9PLEO|nr:hypothetical protein K491DRAFT_125394 [Lophiostoma macrostomum CBS 122681]
MRDLQCCPCAYADFIGKFPKHLGKVFKISSSACIGIGDRDRKGGESNLLAAPPFVMLNMLCWICMQ